MNKDEILNELCSIRDYMDERNALHGFGQMEILIEKLEQEDMVEQDLSSRLQKGRDYLMQVQPSEFDASEALQEFGYNSNGY